MTADDPVVARTLADSKVYHVDFENSDGYNDDDVRTDRPADECNVVTSEIERGMFAGRHRLLLDLDVPAALVPSTTPGHSHLYVDVAAQWPAIERALHALADCGVIEDGYASASSARGHTALRMPHVRKEVADHEHERS